MIYTQPMALHSRYPTAFGSSALEAGSNIRSLIKRFGRHGGSRLRPNAVRSLVRDFRWHSSASPAFAPGAGPNAGLLKLRINRFRKFSTAIIARLELSPQVLLAPFGGFGAARRRCGSARSPTAGVGVDAHAGVGVDETAAERLGVEVSLAGKVGSPIGELNRRRPKRHERKAQDLWTELGS
jgi:hypothetical protein